MSFWDEIKTIFRAVWNNDITYINKCMLEDRDIVSGEPMSAIKREINKRLAVETSPIENSSTISYKIKELEYKLKNNNISEQERSTLKKHLNLLYEKYEELLENEKDKTYYDTIDTSR